MSNKNQLRLLEAKIACLEGGDISALVAKDLLDVLQLELIEQTGLQLKDGENPLSVFTLIQKLKDTYLSMASELRDTPEESPPRQRDLEDLIQEIKSEGASQ